jgi:phosphoglycolate phosphatase
MTGTPRPLRAVFFDLDGTLADTLGDIASAMNRAIALRDIKPLETDAYKPLVGWGMRRLALSVLPERLHDDETVSATLAAMRAFYAEAPCARTRAYPGVLELLLALKSSGFAIGVISNKDDSLTRLVLAGLFPEIAFDAASGAREGFAHKPDPALLLSLVKGLGLSPAECALVGDSGVDMQTARNAGMLGVGAAWGYRTRRELLESGAAFIADRAENVLSLVEERRG